MPVSPLLLNNVYFRDAVVHFTDALGKEAYKEGCIGLISGLGGSALGVVGALFVMHTEQKKEMLEFKMLFQRLGRLDADGAFNHHVCAQEDKREFRPVVICDVMELRRKHKDKSKAI